MPVAEHEAALRGMPGAVNVVLKAGSCLLYNPLLWHGASYVPSWERPRATFHGGWRHPALPYQLTTMRWGLEHNPWLAKPEYMGDLGPYFGAQLGNLHRVMRHFAPQLTAQPRL